MIKYVAGSPTTVKLLRDAISVLQEVGTSGGEILAIADLVLIARLILTVRKETSGE